MQWKKKAKAVVLLTSVLVLVLHADSSGGWEKSRWNPGDTVTREIHGESYRFRCIDQNYSDGMEHHRPGALFLCDTVIPANTGSEYAFETPPGEEHDYVFYPGPVVNFGESCEYKESAIRAWLKAAEPAIAGAEPINIGVTRAYAGSTPDEMFGSFTTGTMSGRYIGSQKMTDRLFILSVDEAIRYRDWLWRFEGAKTENPESQYSSFCKGYWLRTPVRSGKDMIQDQIYLVDLVNGMIRPASIMPKHNDADADAELQVTGTTGIRPAFVLPQR